MIIWPFQSQMIFRILQIAVPFIWFGAVAAISFVEAPLKFTAPGITIPLGLGIGQIVFHTLNRVEIVLCLIVVLARFAVRKRVMAGGVLLGIAAAILAVQTLWLLPLLDARAEAVIGGNAAPFSNLHIYYIVSETLKLVVLFALGTVIVKKNLGPDERH